MHNDLDQLSWDLLAGKSFTLMKKSRSSKQEIFMNRKGNKHREAKGFYICRYQPIMQYPCSHWQIAFSQSATGITFVKGQKLREVTIPDSECELKSKSKFFNWYFKNKTLFHQRKEFFTASTLGFQNLFIFIKDTKRLLYCTIYLCLRVYNLLFIGLLFFLAC